MCLIRKTYERIYIEERFRSLVKPLVPSCFRSLRIFYIAKSVARIETCPTCKNYEIRRQDLQRLGRSVGQARPAKFRSIRKNKKLLDADLRDLRNCILLCDSMCLGRRVKISSVIRAL